MTPKAVLVRMLADLEAEYRYWLVEEIRLGRGIDEIEQSINQHESEFGAERTAEFRARLARTRQQYRALAEKMRDIRHRLDDLRARLEAMP